MIQVVTGIQSIVNGLCSACVYVRRCTVCTYNPLTPCLSVCVCVCGECIVYFLRFFSADLFFLAVATAKDKVALPRRYTHTHRHPHKSSFLILFQQTRPTCPVTSASTAINESMVHLWGALTVHVETEGPTVRMCALVWEICLLIDPLTS